jgi:molybdopterin molybdotransferase
LTGFMLSYEQARKRIVDEVSARNRRPQREPVPVWEALGLVLEREVKADRDYPPFDRSTRDGYAVRATEALAGAKLRCIGESKAGGLFAGTLAPGECVQIMTGAAVPAGADAVVMLEHTRHVGDQVTIEREAHVGQNIVEQGSEACAGQVLLRPGMRLGFAELALAAQVGATELLVAKRPRVAILSTGDEVVPVTAMPGPTEIRNSNSVSLAAQTHLAGGEPVLLGNAADREDDLRKKIEAGLREPLLVLSGGVSMGKYDLVELVLHDLGTQFFFDAVAIRPGRPVVCGRCGDTFVFGLPGNPVSTMVTFELFVAPAIDLLSGAEARPLPLVEARLAAPMREKPGLAHFLPARVDWPKGDPEVRALAWQGSGDIGALARANCFLVVPAEKEALAAGETVQILLRKDIV